MGRRRDSARDWEDRLMGAPVADAQLSPGDPVSFVNGSAYTLSLVDVPSDGPVDPSQLESSARAAIEYLGGFIRWQGVLDFVIQVDRRRILGSYWYDKGPGFAAYGAITPEGQTVALAEALSGKDANGDGYDLGLWLSPDAGPLVDYGVPVLVDAQPQPGAEVPASDGRDFFSVFVHEALHGLGFWSLDQHGAGSTAFDALTESVNGRWFFTGAEATQVNGGPVLLADVGSRDHYDDALPAEREMMREYGANGRWQISNLDLAILKDLGHDIRTWLPEPSDPPLLDLPVSSAPDPQPAADPRPERGQEVLASIPADEERRDQLEEPEYFWLDQSTALRLGPFDPLIQFSKERGDKLVLPQDRFDDPEEIRFKVADSKRQLRKLARSGKDLVYASWSGGLYLNDNARERGWGEGGRLVRLEDAPLIGVDDLVLMP